LYQVEALAAWKGWTPALQRQAGDLWQQIGDLSAAATYWEAALIAQSDDVNLLRQLAEAYLQLQRWPETSETLRRLTELTPDDRWAHYHLGLILAGFDSDAAVIHLTSAADSPDYAAVVIDLLNVLAASSDDPLLPMRVGIVLGDHELWAYAELAFTYAVASAPAPAEALAYVGLSRQQQGKDGTSWINQAATLEPNNPQVLLFQALNLRGKGAYQQSLDVLLHAVRVDPENPALHAELGTAYQLLGDISQAEYWLRIAVDMSAGAPEFQDLLTQFYADEALSLGSTALETLKQAVNETPDDPDTRASYGWALHSAGDSEAGLAEIDAALELAPANPRALVYKARVLLEIGRTDEAIPLLEQVVQMDSEFAVEAQRILQNLESGR
jgi:tetratricopeptide (TPR) repeat protein